MTLRVRRNRVCAREGCDTVLSRYNNSRYCAPCDDPRAIRLPRPPEVHKKAPGSD